MNLIYDILFRVNFLHDYYDSGFTEDFEISPTPSCQKMMNDRGFLFRKEEFGFVILAKIKPKINGQAPELFTSLGGEMLRFAFEMKLKNTYFGNITTLPTYDLGTEVFYFSNLHNTVNAGAPVLGDQIAGATLGTPIELLSGFTQNVAFSHPLQTANIEVRDIFQNQKTPVEQLTLTGNDESPDIQLDFRTIEQLFPGRYSTHWAGNGSQGADAGSKNFILEPNASFDNTFGIIEIFNNTTEFPNNVGNNVPLTHRFLDGDTLVRAGLNNDQITANFQVRLNAHPAVKWHYVLIKNSTSITPTLANLAIANFAETVAPEHVPVPGSKVLRSQNNIPVKETQQAFTLTSDLANFSPAMPQPEMGSNLKRINGQDPFYELYYYV